MSDTTVVPQAAPRMEGLPLTFLSQDGPSPARRGDVDGLAIRVRLTSYRSLPLSCVHAIGLAIDGEPVPRQRITFILDGNAYALEDLAERTDLWWYILDFAELFLPLDAPLAPGRHELEGSLTTLVPFATGGRVTHSARSRMQFIIDPEDRR